MRVIPATMPAGPAPTTSTCTWSGSNCPDSRNPVMASDAKHPPWTPSRRPLRPPIDRQAAAKTSPSGRRGRSYGIGEATMTCTYPRIRGLWPKGGDPRRPQRRPRPPRLRGARIPVDRRAPPGPVVTPAGYPRHIPAGCLVVQRETTNTSSGEQAAREPPRPASPSPRDRARTAPPAHSDPHTRPTRRNHDDPGTVVHRAACPRSAWRKWPPH